MKELQKITQDEIKWNTFVSLAKRIITVKKSNISKEALSHHKAIRVAAHGK